MSDKRFFGFGEFGAWVKEQVGGVTQALGLKADASSVHTKEEAAAAFLGINDTAANAAQLDGTDKATLINETLVAANLGSKLDVGAQAADSANLGGQTPEYFATAAAVTQLETDVNAMLTDLTTAFQNGATTISGA